jgi:hypothetical protein
MGLAASDGSSRNEHHVGTDSRFRREAAEVGSREKSFVD